MPRFAAAAGPSTSRSSYLSCIDATIASIISAAMASASSSNEPYCQNLNLGDAFQIFCSMLALKSLWPFFSSSCLSTIALTFSEKVVN